MLAEMEAESLRGETLSPGEMMPSDGYELICSTGSGIFIDGFPISHPVGHRGSLVRADFLLTFLPRAVVDSLQSVMEKAGLESAGLTLEPVAALEAVVPDKNRLMNLALVDVGAGTSDIAITRNGSAASFAMVPYAGDKVTERLCDRYLTDFKTGEQIKREMLVNKGEIAYIDFFGRGATVSFQDAYVTILPVLKEMARRIADVILSGNQRHPSAVMVVGGGCRLPQFEKHLAEALDMGADRIVICDRRAIAGIRCDLDILTGSDAITPLGIALHGMRADGAGERYYTIRLNGKPVRASEGENYTVSDVLDAASYDRAKLTARNGLPLHFYLNGKPETAEGGAGVQSEIRVNGNTAGLETAVNPEDDVTVKDARDGFDARVYVSDFSPRAEVGTVACSGVDYYIAPKASVNGNECALSAEIREGDRVELTIKTTVGMFVAEYMPEMSGADYYVDGVCVDGAHELAPGNELSFVLNAPDGPGLAQPEPEDSEPADFEPATPAPPSPSFPLDINGEYVSVHIEPATPLLVDAFNYVAIDRPDGPGRLFLRLNGLPARLTDRIAPDDKIVIKWNIDEW